MVGKTEEATRTFNHLWSEESIQISLNKCKRSKPTSKVYHSDTLGN